MVEAKGKKGMAARQFQRNAPPPLPKLEDDGNPKFVIFIRMADVRLFSLSLTHMYLSMQAFFLILLYSFGYLNDEDMG